MTHLGIWDVLVVETPQEEVLRRVTTCNPVEMLLLVGHALNVLEAIGSSNLLRSDNGRPLQVIAEQGGVDEEGKVMRVSL